MGRSAGNFAGSAVNSKVVSLSHRQSHIFIISDLPRQLSGQIEEWLLVVVIGLGRYVVVLQVLLSVEGDHLGLDLPVLHVHFISTEDNGDIRTDANEIAMPVRDVLVGGSSGDVEHDDGCLTLYAA